MSVSGTTSTCDQREQPSQQEPVPSQREDTSQQVPSTSWSVPHAKPKRIIFGAVAKSAAQQRQLPQPPDCADNTPTTSHLERNSMFDVEAPLMLDCTKINLKILRKRRRAERKAANDAGLPWYRVSDRSPTPYHQRAIIDCTP